MLATVWPPRSSGNFGARAQRRPKNPINAFFFTVFLGIGLYRSDEYTVCPSAIKHF